MHSSTNTVCIATVLALVAMVTEVTAMAVLRPCCVPDVYSYRETTTGFNKDFQTINFRGSFAFDYVNKIMVSRIDNDNVTVVSMQATGTVYTYDNVTCHKTTDQEVLIPDQCRFCDFEASGSGYLSAGSSTVDYIDSTETITEGQADQYSLVNVHRSTIVNQRLIQLSAKQFSLLLGIIKQKVTFTSYEEYKSPVGQDVFELPKHCDEA